RAPDVTGAASSGKTGRRLRPASQETCHGEETSTGGVSGGRCGRHSANVRSPAFIATCPSHRGMEMSISCKVPVATLGVPRIGRKRELKFALEAYWAGKSPAAELLQTAKALRAASWTAQRDRGVTKIPS